MKCSCCGEEVGKVSICPVCGSAVAPKAEPERRAPVYGGSSASPSDGNPYLKGTSAGGVAPAPQPAQPSAASGAQSSGATPASDGVDVFEKNINGILEIETDYGRASGFLFDRMGHAITNAHAVCDDDGKSCGRCRIKIAKQVVIAEVISMCTEDPRDHCSNKDLALIRLKEVPKDAEVLEFGNYENVRTGEKVFVIGNSLGYGTCITSGIVSDRDRDGSIMTDCAVNPGNSGGPIFDANGKVIGAVVAGIDSAEGMNFAIPISEVKNFIRKNGLHI